MKKVTNINLNVLNYLEWPGLLKASWMGHQCVVQLLLDSGCDIDQINKLGEFILFIFLFIYHIINYIDQKNIYGDFILFS